MTTRSVLLLLIFSMLTACAASSRGRFGSVAVYSEDRHAWVAQKDQFAWTFTDPLSGCALLCRDDVERWARVNSSAARASLHRVGAMKTGMLVTLPLALPGALLFLPALGVGAAVSPPDASEDRKRGDAARAHGAIDEAVSSYLLASAQGDGAAREMLAQIWIQQGHIDEAARARHMLFCAGAPLGASKWRDIEDWLSEHNSPPPKCANESKVPVEIPWED